MPISQLQASCVADLLTGLRLHCLIWQIIMELDQPQNLLNDGYV